MKRATSFAALVITWATVALPVHAQQWSAEVQAGRIRSALDPLGRESGSVVLGLRYDDPLSALRLSAGVPAGDEAPLWASLAAARRLALRRHGLVAGVDIAGNGFLLHDRAQHTRELPGLFGSQFEPVPGSSGHALAGQALPLLGFESTRAQAYVRAGVSHYTSGFGGQSRSRTVRLADLQLTLSPAQSFSILPVLRRYDADEGSFTYGGATGLLTIGPASVWGSVGGWLDVDSVATPWAGGVMLRVHPRATLMASARHDSFDPLYASPAQSGWSVGATVQLGGRAVPVAPVPARYAGGRATIQLPVASSPTAPGVAGDFNGWKAQTMQRSGKYWTLTVAMPPGVYNYAFVNARGEWFVPEKHPGRKDDGMGGHVAVLVVQ